MNVKPPVASVSAPPIFWRLLRSSLFHLGFWINIAGWALTIALAIPLPFRWRYKLACWWCRNVCLMITFFAGVKIELRGFEQLPKEPCMIFAKHQSALETIVLFGHLPPSSFILKRSLLWIPFFGWPLWTLGEITVNRELGARTFFNLISACRERLQEGRHVVLFPEGTRRPVSEAGCGKYKPGAAALALRCRSRIVPVAINTGLFWQSGSMVIFPGTAVLKMGPPMGGPGGSTRELESQVNSWLDRESQKLLEEAEQKSVKRIL